MTGEEDGGEREKKRQWKEAKKKRLSRKTIKNYKKHQIYSFPRFGSFRRTLLYLMGKKQFVLTIFEAN